MQFKQQKIKNETLYDKDFAAWSDEQTLLLEQRRYEELDLVNLTEEVKNLGSNDKYAHELLQAQCSEAE